MKTAIALLWNPINVIEGEGKWMAAVLFICGLSWLLSRIFEGVVEKMKKQERASHLRVVMESLYLPALVLLWFLAVLFSLDIVTERWFSKEWNFLFYAFAKTAASLLFGWFLFRYKTAFVIYTIDQKKTKDPQIAEVVRALSKVASVLIVIVVLFLVHDSTGLSMTAVLAFGGVGGLAVAFASQEIVQNFFGGFMLHMTRPFFHGELIDLPQHSISGTVERIGWYQTTVRSKERVAIYIPNSMFTRACVTNRTRTVGRLMSLSLHVEMLSLDQMRQFCLLLDEKLRSMDEVDSNERISVWIESLYGATAKVSVFAIVRSMSLDSFYKLQTSLFIEAGKTAQQLGGCLTSSPSSCCCSKD